MRKSTALYIATYALDIVQRLLPERSYFLPVRTSMQALLETLVYEKNGIILHDEIATFFSTLEKNYNGDMKSILTSCFGVPSQIVTEFKSTGKTIIENPIFSIAAASTPAWLKNDMKKHDVTSGFLARFLFCYQEKNERVLPFPDKPDSQELLNIVDFFESLYDLQPEEMIIDDEFKALYSDFYKATRGLIDNITTNNGLEAVFGRLQTDYFFKFAILEGVLSNRTILNKNDAERAIYLCTYYMAQATKVLQIIDETEQVGLEKKIFNAIKAKPGISKTEIHKVLSNHEPSDKINRILKGLETAERIEIRPVISDKGRTRSTFHPISP
jgi:hypothetical protein